MEKQKRIFVFRERSKGRPMLHAFPENEIYSIKSQWGSQNVYLEINGIEVEGSFDELLKILGERVDFN